ncbi:HDOD domain-containing protein [Thermosulfuriphilus sp.]
MHYGLLILVIVLLFVFWLKGKEDRLLPEAQEPEAPQRDSNGPFSPQIDISDRLRDSVKIFCLKKICPKVIDALAPEERKRLLARFKEHGLPSGALLRLSELLRDPQADSREISRLAATDPVLSAKLLEVANSAYCRPSGASRVTSVHRAILILGFNQVRALLFKTLISRAFKGLEGLGKEEVQNLWGHSAGVSIVAGQLALRAGIPEGLALTAGLLHDIGKFFLPPAQEELGLSMALSPEEFDLPPVVLEDKIHGYNHTIIGGLLCSFWRLPKEIVLSVAYHHLPSFSDLRGLPQWVAEVVILVSIADYICHLLGFFNEEPILYELSPWICETVGLSYPVRSLIEPELLRELEKTKLLVSAV